MFNLATLFFFCALSFLFTAATFLTRLLDLAADAFGVIYPASLIRRVQVTTILVSFWLLVPLQRDFLPQSAKLKAITLICISLLRALSRSQALSLVAALRVFSWLPGSLVTSKTVDFVWLGHIWARSTWILLERSSTSVALFRRLGFRLMGYLSRWLLTYLWNISLFHIRAFQHDAKTRFGLATSAFLDCVHVLDLSYFFGLTLGLRNFFDPWISLVLKLRKLALLLVPLVPGDLSLYCPHSPWLDGHSTGDETDYTDYGTCDLSDTTSTGGSMDDVTSISHEDLLSDSYASSVTLVSLPAEDDSVNFDLITATTPFADDFDPEEVVVFEGHQEQFYNPLSLFDHEESFMQGLHIDQVIGIGSFGAVYRGFKKGGRLYALKVMKRGVRENLAITLEVAALKRVQGKTDWSVQLQYLQFSNDHVMVAMTYCPGGSLLDLLEVCNGALSPELATFYVAQLILAIHSIHVLGIIHHDIKLDNVMLDSRGNVKLIDFGLSITFDHDNVSANKYPEFVELRTFGGDQFPLLWAMRHNPHTLDHAFGTEGYTAPEVWKGQPHSYGVDYFGAACIFHWLITGTAPFEYDPETDDFSKEIVYIYREELGISDVEYSFLSCALHERPHKRLTVGQMKAHPLFSDIDWLALNRGEVAPPIVPYF